MSNEKTSFIGKLFSKTWAVLNFSRVALLNLIFFIILFLFVAAIFDDSDEIVVPMSSALILNLTGDIVEQKREIDPVDAFFNQAMNKPDEKPEVLLSDIIKVINRAKTDERIKTLVINSPRLGRTGLTKLQDIASAITDFKESGKPVIAFAEYYSQDHYYLASLADKIWLVPNGWFAIDGYGRFQLYFKSAIEKLNISQHIFRVGTYKSAVEPYIRDDMSEAAKLANKEWLNDLWSNYKADVAEQRGFSVANFDESLEIFLSKFKDADANFAQYALNNNWVDELKTHEQMRRELTSLVGKAKEGNNYSHIGFRDYLRATSTFEFVNPNTDKVAVIVAKGTILNGHQAPGTIGGASTAKLLRKARLNDKVKAVVLRVDSPGGSSFASEIIREEIDLIKESGKPVIASMGTYAASGGYWISASANQIWASPNTITGSIGIFGMFMTLENTLDKLGIHADGVGTTEMSGFGITRPLSDNMANLFQLSINRGYQDFIGLVAKNRNMTLEQVDKIAQGRVWSGQKAKEIGLVDELGSLDDAVDAAAKLAGLDHYDRLLVEKELSARDKFLREMLGQATAIVDSDSDYQQADNKLMTLVSHLLGEFNQISQLNDPQGIYAFCLTCEIE